MRQRLYRKKGDARILLLIESAVLWLGVDYYARMFFPLPCKANDNGDAR
jgi:hypothetical protein